MKRINICYTRCSTEQQDTDHQIKSINEYAAKNNITIDKYISDAGLSGFRLDITQRPGIIEVIELVKQDKVANLLIFESSRISRRMVQYQTVMDTFTQHNTRVHSVSENTILNANDIDKLLNAFKGWMAEQSSVETGRRVKSAHAKLRAEGKFVAGGIPYGFQIDSDGYLVPIEELRPEIVSFFEDYINYSTKYVAEKYGVANRKTLIDRISNDKYIDIVGNGLFIRANRIKESRKCTSKSSANQLNRTNVLFEGLLVHKVCQKKLYLNRDYRSKNKPHSYRCKCCKNNKTITSKKSFSGKKLDSYIESQILEILDNLNHEKLVDQYNSRCTKKKLVLEIQLKNLKQELSEINTTITKANAKLTTFILNDADDSAIGIITELISNKNKKAAQIQQLVSEKEAEIQHLTESEAANEALIADILNARDIYKSASIQQKKAVLQLLVARIEVSDINDVDIYLNI